MTEESIPPPLNDDGKAHFTYFDKPRQLSFVWDGVAEYIEVCHGGYGEPASDIISIAPKAMERAGYASTWLQWFEMICKDYLSVTEQP